MDRVFFLAYLIDDQCIDHRLYSRSFVFVKTHAGYRTEASRYSFGLDDRIGGSGYSVRVIWRMQRSARQQGGNWLKDFAGEIRLSATPAMVVVPSCPANVPLPIAVGLSCTRLVGT